MGCAASQPMPEQHKGETPTDAYGAAAKASVAPLPPQPHAGNVVAAIPKAPSKAEADAWVCRGHPTVRRHNIFLSHRVWCDGPTWCASPDPPDATPPVPPWPPFPFSWPRVGVRPFVGRTRSVYRVSSTRTPTPSSVSPAATTIPPPTGRWRLSGMPSMARARVGRLATSSPSSGTSAASSELSLRSWVAAVADSIFNRRSCRT